MRSQKISKTVDDYVVIANINSTKEAVIGGTTAGVEKAMDAVRDAGYVARALQVSHAFHTQHRGAGQASRWPTSWAAWSFVRRTVPIISQRHRRVLSRWARASFPR